MNIDPPGPDWEPLPELPAEQVLELRRAANAKVRAEAHAKLDKLLDETFAMERDVPTPPAEKLQ